MLRRLFRLALPIVTALSVGAPVASAAAPPKDPRRAVSKAYDAIQKKSATALNKATLNAGITKILDEVVDWSAFSAKTVGQTLWGEFTPDQKARFLTAYKRLITKKYAGRFKPKPTKPFEVQFRGKTDTSKKGAAVVKTTVFTYDDGKRVGVDVDYHFVLTGAKYGVRDIVTDTVSRALSYRKKFKLIYRKRGFEALVARIDKNANKRTSK